MTLTSP